MRVAARIGVATSLLALAQPLHAQSTLLDSLRPRVESAVARADWNALDPIAARLRAEANGPAADDPWTHYDLAYVLHRRASELLVELRDEQARPLLEEADRELVKAQQLGGGGAALGLRGAVTGQLAGLDGIVTVMRMGRRSFKQLDTALAVAPRDPRVALLNGITRLNAPPAFGGGAAKAEPELRRAVLLFETDRPVGRVPAWGRVDALIWHAIALEKLGRTREARSALMKALRVSPGHAWITQELLPRLDAPR